MENRYQYRVMVVDDEPVSLRHICKVIEARCPEFLVVETALDGQQALDKLKESGEFLPDVIFSDVIMPLMNGIELVSEVKRQWPEIMTVIVSGYSDFEYAKGAISAGVCEYLLKPVRPCDVELLMGKLKEKLDDSYYEMRMTALRDIAGGTGDFSMVNIQKLFRDETYYCGIFRKNGVPSRFTRRSGRDLCSVPHETIMVYGRDVMESLYLCPGSLMEIQEFQTYFWDICGKNQDNRMYCTSVVYPQEITLKNLAGILKRMFRFLDEHIVIGKSQTLFYKEENNAQKMVPEEDDLDDLEYYMKHKNTVLIKKECRNLLHRWEEEMRSQLWMEDRIRYMLFRFVGRGYICRPDPYILDDLFVQSVTVGELTEGIISLLCFGEEETVNDTREEMFQKILFYLEEHLDEEISIPVICRKFGISQTTLGRLFRQFGKNSFSASVTSLRMEKAKRLLLEQPDTKIRIIGERVGYADQFYFSRVFRSYFGCSPVEFRGE